MQPRAASRAVVSVAFGVIALALAWVAGFVFSGLQGAVVLAAIFALVVVATMFGPSRVARAARSHLPCLLRTWPNRLDLARGGYLAGAQLRRSADQPVHYDPGAWRVYVGLGDELTTRASAIIGMVASAVWIVALVVEYQFRLRPPGDGSGLYRVDQAAFALAELGYLILLIGLFRSHAGGDGRFGRISLGIWAIAIAALVIAQILGLFGAVVIPLLPIGGLGQLIGSILTAIAVWRAGRWMGWRRFAPAIWAFYTLILFGAIATAMPGLANPALAPYPTSPSELAEAGWQVTWFLVGIALYIESGRLTHLPTPTN